MAWARAHPRQTGLIVAALALLLDQGLKYLVLYGLGLAHTGPGHAVPVLPFLNFVMVWNSGISYGWLQARGPETTVFLATFQMLAAGGLTWWLWSVRGLGPAISIGLVIGGALGNLTDRLIYGAVADFIHLHAFGRGFYVFNPADAAITLGVVGWLYETFVRHGAAGAEKRP